jgi:hypothetical protein
MHKAMKELISYVLLYIKIKIRGTLINCKLFHLQLSHFMLSKLNIENFEYNNNNT